MGRSSVFMLLTVFCSQIIRLEECLALLDNSLKFVDTKQENNIFPTIDNTFHSLQHFSVMRRCSKK